MPAGFLLRGCLQGEVPDRQRNLLYRLPTGALLGVWLRRCAIRGLGWCGPCGVGWAVLTGRGSGRSRRAPSRRRTAPPSRPRATSTFSTSSRRATHTHTHAKQHTHTHIQGTCTQTKALTHITRPIHACAGAGAGLLPAQRLLGRRGPRLLQHAARGGPGHGAGRRRGGRRAGAARRRDAAGRPPVHARADMCGRAGMQLHRVGA